MRQAVKTIEGGKSKSKDYVDKRFVEAPLKAVEILVEHSSEWSNEVDAYWLLRRYEDEIGVPVTYDIVVEAVEAARRRLEAEKAKVHVAEESS